MSQTPKAQTIIHKPYIRNVFFHVLSYILTYITSDDDEIGNPRSKPKECCWFSCFKGENESHWQLFRFWDHVVSPHSLWCVVQLDILLKLAKCSMQYFECVAIRLLVSAGWLLGCSLWLLGWPKWKYMRVGSFFNINLQFVVVVVLSIMAHCLESNGTPFLIKLSPYNPPGSSDQEWDHFKSSWNRKKIDEDDPHQLLQELILSGNLIKEAVRRLQFPSEPAENDISKPVDWVHEPAYAWTSSRFSDHGADSSLSYVGFYKLWYHTLIIFLLYITDMEMLCTLDCFAMWPFLFSNFIWFISVFELKCKCDAKIYLVVYSIL